jgi:hypothetical protein
MAMNLRVALKFYELPASQRLCSMELVNRHEQKKKKYIQHAVLMCRPNKIRKCLETDSGIQDVPYPVGIGGSFPGSNEAEA